MTQTFMPLLIESKGTVIKNASLAGVLNVPWGCMSLLLSYWLRELS
jgi:hypothetical protein